MALRSTIYKADLQIADMDRNYYGSHALTVARHPSETDERMMVRILTFALNAEEALAMSKGLSGPDEPDIWAKDLTGAIEHWIDLGQPDEKRMSKASSRATRATVYPFGPAADVWWKPLENKVARLDNLRIVRIAARSAQALAGLAERGMELQVTVQDGQAWVSSAKDSVEVELETLKG
ncbi:MAG: YaeQ family protein [Candidatus Protistobacter heckmanni]|nr:YaeQ family protein [Candidatus Protistobacter heckmanni]